MGSGGSGCARRSGMEGSGGRGGGGADGSDVIYPLHLSTTTPASRKHLDPTSEATPASAASHD